MPVTQIVGVEIAPIPLVVNVLNDFYPTHEENHMDTQSTFINARSLLAAAVAAGMLFSGDVLADNGPVSVAVSVSTRGIDPSQPAGAHEIYRRLRDAAWIVCTRANRVGLEPLADPEACSEKALGEAIRSAHIPLLTQAYLQKHSLEQAVAHGIDLPLQVAAK